jgi:hypothetical protein
MPKSIKFLYDSSASDANLSSSKSDSSPNPFTCGREAEILSNSLYVFSSAIAVFGSIFFGGT